LECEPWGEVSQNAKDLIRKLLNIDSEKRISAKEALEHPWVENDTYIP